MGRGEGGATKREGGGGHVKLYLWRGAEPCMLKGGGGKQFWGSFYSVFTL